MTSSHDTTGHDEASVRRANRRLAIALGLVALAFYLVMLFVMPQ